VSNALYIQHVWKEQASGFIRYQSRSASTVGCTGGTKKARMVGFQGDGHLPAAYTAHHLSLVGSDHVPTTPHQKKKSLTSINCNKCYIKCYRHFCQLLASPYYSYYFVSSTEECWRPQNTACVATLCCPLARDAVPTVGSPVSVSVTALLYVCWNRYSSGLSSAPAEAVSKSNSSPLPYVVYPTSKYIYSPVNSAVRQLCSRTGSCKKKMFSNDIWHHDHSFSPQQKDVLLSRILPNVSPSFPQRLGPQSWVSNCTSLSNRSSWFNIFIH